MSLLLDDRSSRSSARAPTRSRVTTRAVMAHHDVLRDASALRAMADADLRMAWSQARAGSLDERYYRKQRRNLRSVARALLRTANEPEQRSQP
jgi:hypothetical protein